MQGVIKMGFPEWTISGISLLAREVGLTYAKSAIRPDPLPTPFIRAGAMGLLRRD